MNSYKGIDCWKTWFIDECQNSHLFGVRYFNQIQLYEIATQIYLEDEPFFRSTDKKEHRICGPHIIVESTPEDPYEIKKGEDGEIIIYKDIHPSRGPWVDNTAATRIVRNIEVKYTQYASMFDFFPYRFSIERVQDGDIFVPHTASCNLCSEGR